jgi:hypothetical protein
MIAFPDENNQDVPSLDGKSGNESPAKRKNGQDSKGKFQKGNKLGRGNPLLKHSERLRAALLQAVTKEDIGAIARGLVASARKGSPTAAALLFDRIFGKANQPIEMSATVKHEIVSALPQLMGDPRAFEAAKELSKRMMEMSEN